MLIIPPQFREVMKQWLVNKPSRVVRLSAAKWCEFWVQIQKFEGHMVLGRGWEYFCRHPRIVAGDLLVPRISMLGLKVHIFNKKSSPAPCAAPSTSAWATSAWPSDPVYMLSVYA